VANVTAAQANVKRLQGLQGFEKVIAPFTGVVTGRAFDRGSLILADPTAADIKPMFKIAENDVLRAFVNVPQSNALLIRKGMTVDITVREQPNRKFKGTVMGTTNYLDPANRSLLTEVKLPNPTEPDGRLALLPGMYCEASFNVTRQTPPLRIPGPAVVNNAQGTQVATVRDGKVHFQKIVLGQDYGSEVEVTDGLTGDEAIIANPGERTVEGAAVSTGAAEEKKVRVSEAGK
jgi:RND family efflux transporter MFP subunit